MGKEDHEFMLTRVKVLLRHLSGDFEEAVLGRDIDQELKGAVWASDNKHLRLVRM